MIQAPNVTKKDFVVVNIDDDRYVTLLNEDTCAVRNDMEIKQDSDIGRDIIDRFNDGNGQIKVTVLKALGEEQIIAFKVID